MGKEAVSSLINSIDAAQQAALDKKALAGQVRALELTWMRLVNKDSIIVRPAFTDRERGQMKDLIERFGREEALTLMRWATENWLLLAKLPYLRLPPAPVFGDFYFQRERIWATWKADAQKQRDVQEQLAERERLAEERQRVHTPPAGGKSLTEMVLEERRRHTGEVV